MFVMRDALVRRDEGLEAAHRPTCTLEEFPVYVWSDKKEEAPVKVDDHGLDALRYVVMHRESPSVARFRWVE